MLWHEKGGAGTPTILLLHGLGATAAVWTGVKHALQERGIGRWIAPDLSGHGFSEPLPLYSVGSLAAQLAGLIRDEPETYIIGQDVHWLRHGIIQTEQGWRLSQDPPTFAVAGARFASLTAATPSRFMLARGEHDPMVSTAELQLYCPDTHEIAGSGHNPHVERPADIVGLLERLLKK